MLIEYLKHEKMNIKNAYFIHFTFKKIYLHLVLILLMSINKDWTV